MFRNIFRTKIKAILALAGVVSLVSVLILVSSFYLFDETRSPEAYKSEVFQKLRELRIQKKATALAFLRNQYDIAKTVQRDRRYIDAFLQMLSLFESRKYGTLQFWELNRKWEEMYVYELGMFYDILLLDEQGNIFYTIKMEGDFLSNINNQAFQDTNLRKSIETLGSEISFVDYEYYAISEEPASFYLVPLFAESKKIGTIVFQLPLNEINRILTNYPKLGKTVEVYLVNQKGLMLTESRFLNDEIILHKRISTEAVKNAMADGAGEDIIIDYRGKRVFSSYENFKFEGTAWTIIAEIDEEEVITDLYKLWQDRIFDQILFVSSSHPSISSGNTRQRDSSEIDGNRIRVDLKEYGSTKARDRLYTVGVSTCTAVSIHVPESFSYLLHITPTDEIYEIGWNEKMMLGRAYTNMIDEVMSRILWFDIYPYDRVSLKYGVFATQANGLKRAIQKLLENGAMLAQIKMVYKPSFDTVSVEVNHGDDRVWSIWESAEDHSETIIELANVPDLEQIFKQAINY